MTPFVPRTHTFLAWAYLHANRPADALASALRSLELEGPDRSIVYPVIARAYEEQREYAKASDAWATAVKTRGGDQWLNWAMRARAEASAGRLDAALSSVDTAAARANKDPRPSATVQKLKQAIRSDCFPAGGTCDPLVGWQLAVATPAGQASTPR